MAFVVDASVGLKWVLQEPDSPQAERLARSDVELLVPDFWLNEACNVLWLRVRRKLFTPDEARDALALLRDQVDPTPTADLGLHDIALDIGLAINHSPYRHAVRRLRPRDGGRQSRGCRRPVRGGDARPSRSRLANILLPLAAWAGNPEV